LTRYVPQERDRGDILWDPDAFGHALTVAARLASSGLLPDAFREQPANVLIALQVARRMELDPFLVLQSIHVISGRPSWATKFLIALCNRSGFAVKWRVKRLDTPALEFNREEIIGWESMPNGKNRPKKAKTPASMPNIEVTAWSPALDPDDTYTVDSTMAVAEGWAVSNKKYSTNPELMLRYRAASGLIGLYRPEILHGIPVEDEPDVLVVESVTTPAPAPAPTAAPALGMAALHSAVASPPAPAAPTPQNNSSHSNEREQGAAEPAAKPAGERDFDPKAAADLVHKLLAEKNPKGDPVKIPSEAFRKRLREVLVVSKMPENRYQEVIRVGKAAGFWHVTENETVVYTPAIPADPPPEVETPPAAPLIVQLTDTISLLEAEEDGPEIIARACVEVGGIEIDGDGPILAGLPDEKLSALLAKLPSRRLRGEP
jgi:hypothetical protein